MEGEKLSESQIVADSTDCRGFWVFGFIDGFCEESGVGLLSLRGSRDREIAPTEESHTFPRRDPR